MNIYSDVRLIHQGRLLNTPRWQPRGARPKSLRGTLSGPAGGHVADSRRGRGSPQLHFSCWGGTIHQGKWMNMGKTGMRWTRIYMDLVEMVDVPHRLLKTSTFVDTTFFCIKSSDLRCFLRQLFAEQVWVLTGTVILFRPWMPSDPWWPWVDPCQTMHPALKTELAMSSSFQSFFGYRV